MSIMAPLRRDVPGASRQAQPQKKGQEKENEY